jgi:hypothetical protein
MPTLIPTLQQGQVLTQLELSERHRQRGFRHRSRCAGVAQFHDARQFVREYGFDLDQPAAPRLILQAHAEAVEFICQNFLTPQQAR